jgi:signal peptide peptidase SppA
MNDVGVNITTTASLAGRPLALRRDVLEALLRDLAAGRIAAVRQEPPRPAVRARPGIGVVRVAGVLEYHLSLLSELFGMGTSTAELRAVIRGFSADPDIKAIVMLVDSPGGSVDGLQELAAAIRAARQRKPVLAIADPMAASAALWVAAQASEFVVTPSGSVGSLGIYGTHEDISQMAEKVGVKVTLVSAGKYKTEGNPYEPLGADARANMQAEVDAYYRQFVDDVAIGRRVSPSRVLADFGEGRMLLAADALAAGMVDGIGTLEAVLSEASNQASKAGATFGAEVRRFKVAAGAAPEPFGAELARHRRAATRRG